MRRLGPDFCFISGLLRHFCLDWSAEQRHQPALSSLARHTYKFQTEIKRFSLRSVSLFARQGNIYDADMKIKINKVPFFNTSTDLLLQVGRLQQSITQLTFVTCQTVIFYGLCVLAFFVTFFFSFSSLLPTSIGAFRPKFWRSSSIWCWEDDTIRGSGSSSSSGLNHFFFFILSVLLSGSVVSTQQQFASRDKDITHASEFRFDVHTEKRVCVCDWIPRMMTSSSDSSGDR